MEVPMKSYGSETKSPAGAKPNSDNGVPHPVYSPAQRPAGLVHESGSAMPSCGLNPQEIARRIGNPDVAAEMRSGTVNDEFTRNASVAETDNGHPDPKEVESKVDALQQRIDQLERENAQLRKANEDGEAFISLHSHDLNEGLGNIGRSTQLILTRSQFAGDPLIHEACTWILNGARQIEAINNSAMLFLRATDAAQKDEAVDLLAAARDAVSILKEKYAACGGEITLGDLPQVKGCSRALLTDVFQNLFENPLKHKRDGVSLKVDVSGTATESGFGVIAVADNGLGIDPVLEEHIFEKFKRGRNIAPGNGLGLFNVYNVITRSGGKVWARNNAAGATFFFSLPLAQLDSISGAATDAGIVIRPAPKELGISAQDADAAAV